MKLFFDHEFKKNPLFLRNIEILPSLTICFYPKYEIESLRFSWLGFTIATSKE